MCTCLIISHSLRTGLAGGNVNVQGEEVKKLDVLANEIFINSLRSSGKVCAMVSEENEDVILVEDPKLKGKYIVVFDPLDGSSNIDAGVAVGTIFGIYSLSNDELPLTPGAKETMLRPGREMIAAGYAMYGSFTTLVLTTGHGVNGYTLDPV
jgi:fructose-1,6-bisphosphatase I